MVLVALNQVSLVQPATSSLYDRHNGQCMIGYIKLHRQILDSSSFKNVHEQMAFAWLLLRAQWQDVDVRYKGIRLSLKRGQLALSYRDFAKEWGWSEAKCRRYVTRLQSDAVVSAASDAGVCIITILNYNKFQDSDKKDDALNDAPLNGKATHQRRTSDAQNKEDNKIINKDIKDISKDISKNIEDSSHVKPQNSNPNESQVHANNKPTRKTIDEFIRQDLEGCGEIPETFRQHAESEGHPDPALEWQMFGDTWRGRGQGNSDWFATWRNRIASSRRNGWFTTPKSQAPSSSAVKHDAVKAAHGDGLRKAVSMEDFGT